jgi:hypothetical protein
MTLMMLRIIDMCFLVFCVVSVVWSVLSSWLFLRLLIGGLDQVLSLSIVVNF